MKLKYQCIMILTLLSCCMATIAWAAPATFQPQEPLDSLVLSMSTDAIAPFDGALTIGTVALERGHDATLLLRLDSIKVAVAKNNYPVGQEMLAEKLVAFMHQGGKVIVGGKCLHSLHIAPDALIQGVQVGTPDLVMGTLFKKGTKILSY